MYKYIGVDEKTSVQTKVLNNDLPLREFPRNLRSDAKTKKIFRFCNLPHEIAAETEGMLYDYPECFATKVLNVSSTKNSRYSIVQRTYVIV